MNRINGFYHAEIALLLIAFLFFMPLTTAAETAATITKEDLSSMLDDPLLLILDVRTGKDWSSSEFKIKGAQRVSLDQLDSWAKKITPDKKIVLYCA
ncbi:MAG: hypothetical protein HKM93_06465 [Desulfobacteraceae bacterium]|nr:hypothetical protein [Desulfobacteraceae bacterium]